jgi:uncharacterized protein (DUF697 family)
MPFFRKAGGSGLGALGTIQTTYSVLTEISFDDVREEALRVPRMLFIGPNDELAYSTLWMLTGIERSDTVKVVGSERDAGDLTRYDVVLVYDPQKAGTADAVRTRLERSDSPTQVFEILNGAAPSGAGNAAQQLRQAITDSIPERAPAIGRAYPAFREAAVKTVVDDTASANAQFALIANVPSIIPVIGSLMSVGADVVVLTKNQLMMVYKIAAINGKDLNNQVVILKELLPVVGAGFFWRTAAREATSFLPFAAGSIPKVVIAFTGTVAAGWAADFYYRKGRKPSYDQVRQYVREASEAALSLPGVGRRKNGADVIH